MLEMRKIILNISFIVLSLAIFAQGVNHNDCLSAQISGSRTVVSGEIETYTHGFAVHTGERFIWKIEGASQVDGQSFSSLVNGEIIKEGNVVNIVWSDDHTIGRISVSPEFPCNVLIDKEVIEFPIIIIPATKIAGGGPPLPTAGQECINSVNEVGVWQQWAIGEPNRENVSFICHPSAFLGIRTSFPQAVLHVAGTARFDGEASMIGLKCNGSQAFFGPATELKVFNNIIIANNTALTNQDRISVDGRIYAKKAHFGGIRLPNTSSAHSDYKLAVDGKIISKDVVVTLDNWSDFVFAPDFKLLPLEEIENYIALHGHLPDVPNEKEVKADGVNLGQMDAILLQKIEELTLHVIELNKRIKELEENK